MNILIISQYCQPESAFKSVPFAKALVKLGHSVHILTGFPNYPTGRLYPGYRINLWQFEKIDGIPILRVPIYPSHDYSIFRRMLNYSSFALSSSFLGPLLIPQIDVVYVYHPPITTIIPALFFKMLRRTPIVLDVNDVWPYELTHFRIFSEQGTLYRLLDFFCRFAYRRATKITVPSRGYIPILQSMGVQPNKIKLIPNWGRIESLKEVFELTTDTSVTNDGLFRVLYAGNMGRAQGLETVLEAARILQLKMGSNVEINFIGDGSNKVHLQNMAKELNLVNVRFFPFCTLAELLNFYRKTDVLLVHLRGIPQLDIAIPSKIIDYLFVGKPIIAAVRGCAAELIRQAGAGICCEPENPKGIANAMEYMSKLPKNVLQEFGENGRQFYLHNLSIDNGARKFAELFAECYRKGR